METRCNSSVYLRLKISLKRQRCIQFLVNLYNTLMASLVAGTKDGTFLWG